jgi:hypothetical protein
MSTGDSNMLTNKWRYSNSTPQAGHMVKENETYENWLMSIIHWWFFPLHFLPFLTFLSIFEGLTYFFFIPAERNTLHLPNSLNRSGWPMESSALTKQRCKSQSKWPFQETVYSLWLWRDNLYTPFFLPFITILLSAMWVPLLSAHKKTTKKISPSTLIFPSNSLTKK